MDDAGGMRGRQRRGELAADRDDAVDRQAFAFEARRQALALHVLHDDEGAAVVLDDVVHGRDVGVIDTRRRARLMKNA